MLDKIQEISQVCEDRFIKISEELQISQYFMRRDFSVSLDSTVEETSIAQENDLEWKENYQTATATPDSSNDVDREL